MDGLEEGKRNEIDEFRMIGKTVYHERLSDPGTLMAVSSRVSGVPGDKHLSTVYLYGNCMLTGIFNCLEHLLL